MNRKRTPFKKSDDDGSDHVVITITGSTINSSHDEDSISFSASLTTKSWWFAAVMLALAVISTILTGITMFFAVTRDTCDF